jgi:hypothetical protein
LIEIDLQGTATALELGKHGAFLRRTIELPHPERRKQRRGHQGNRQQADSHLIQRSGNGPAAISEPVCASN